MNWKFWEEKQEETDLHWISVDDRLPEQGQRCWVLESNSYKGVVVDQEIHMHPRTRIYRPITKTGSLRSHPWGVHRVGDNLKMIRYWIAVPAYDKLEG